MKLTIFENPKLRGGYQQVGEYNGFPVYAGPNPPRDWAAMAADDGKGVFINREVYRALEKTPEFIPFLETICECMIEHGPAYDASKVTRPEEEIKVLEFLREKGFLD